MLEKGFVKIYRSMLSWEWYGDIVTKTVFLHLLLTVNIKDSKWQGIEVPKGSRVISYPILAEELRLSIRQARTAIKHLQTTGEVTVKKHPKFSIISIENWDKFQMVRQSSDKQNDSQTTAKMTVKRQHNKNIKKKEESLDTPKRVSKDGGEVSQYREVGADEW